MRAKASSPSRYHAPAWQRIAELCAGPQRARVGDAERPGRRSNAGALEREETFGRREVGRYWDGCYASHTGKGVSNEKL